MEGITEYIEWNLNCFDNSYPIGEISPFAFYMHAKERTFNLNQYINSSLLKLPKEEQVFFIDFIRSEIKSKLQYANTERNALEKWLSKYNTGYEYLIEKASDINPAAGHTNNLVSILHQEPSDMGVACEFIFEPEMAKVQSNFYNYWYGNFLLDTYRNLEETSKLLETNRDENKLEDIYDLELEEIKLQENKFILGMPLSKVIEHFIKLTEKENKNGNPFLTKKQLLLFIKKGFLQESNIKKQLINYAPGEKGLVIKLFYEFYLFSVVNYSLSRKKEKFINLVVDCFQNFEYSATESFFKPNKTKNKW